jgi:hypothetical protein
MKGFKWFLLILGAVIGALVVVWLVYYRRIPTLRVSYTLGKGRDVSLDWIELK